MKVASIRIEMNHGGADELLKSPEVMAELQRRGHAIAAAAGGEPDFEVETQVGARRGRVVIRTATFAAMKAEATDRVLTAALDAGR